MLILVSEKAVDHVTTDSPVRAGFSQLHGGSCSA